MKTGNVLIGAVWSISEKDKVKKLDKDFNLHLKKKGINPTSREASIEWSEAGFKNRFKKIFNK